MFDRPPFAGFSPFLRLFLVLSLMMLSAGVFFYLSAAVLYQIWGITLTEGQLMTAEAISRNPLSFLVFQSLQSAIGLFIFPAVMAALAISGRPLAYLGLGGGHHIPFVLLTAVVLSAGLSLSLFTDGHVFLEKKAPWAELRSFIAQARLAAEQQKDLLQGLFRPQGTGYLLMLFIGLSVLPAVGEELMFRGVIQRELGHTLLGQRGAILVAALLFSVMHAVWYNALALWFMGILLGCMYYWTGTLWASIFAHGLNNACFVLWEWGVAQGHIPSAWADDAPLPLWISGLSAGCLLFLLYLLFSQRKPSGMPAAKE